METKKLSREEQKKLEARRKKLRKKIMPSLVKAAKQRGVYYK